MFADRGSLVEMEEAEIAGEETGTGVAEGTGMVVGTDCCVATQGNLAAYSVDVGVEEETEEAWKVQLQSWNRSPPSFLP